MKTLVLAVMAVVAGAAAAERYDVVVYGGTPAGIAAGVTAAREGASVVVIEPTRWIGGMVTGGLARSDVGKKETVGGFAKEFFSKASAGYDPKWMWYAEPKTNMAVFESMLAEAKVKVVKGAKLKEVLKTEGMIERLTTLDGTVYEGRQFIDASYEGDLMAKAGVTYRVGREARSEYGEPLAGFQLVPLRPRSNEVMASGKAGPSYIHGTPAEIPALDDKGEPIFGVTRAKAKTGSADGLTQAYNFRVVVTQREDLMLPFPKPGNYQPEKYELLLRLIGSFRHVAFTRLFHLGEIAGGKFDLNAQGLVSTDYPGANTGYPDGDWAEREKIRQEHIDYIQGMLWFLGNDPRVPEELRKETNSWGLCRDEFTDHGNWPHALYVREARRMKGAYVMVQDDCQRKVRKPDSVGMGSFVIDCHIVQRVVTEDGLVTDEGSFPDAPTQPYQIPYRCLTPRPEECGNLLVPVCFSASHIAYCSLRMEPVYMAMGQASGLAAVQALGSGTGVQDIDVEALRKSLQNQGAVLELDVPGALLVEEMQGVVVDDADGQLVGDWISSNYGAPVNLSSVHDGGEGQGEKSATFRLKVPAKGTYDLRFYYSAASNRASNAKVMVVRGDRSSLIEVDQRKLAAYASLGKDNFAEGEEIVVKIVNNDADGIVSVDAVQLAPVK
jgi:hypothetical protein